MQIVDDDDDDDEEEEDDKADDVEYKVMPGLVAKLIIQLQWQDILFKEGNKTEVESVQLEDFWLWIEILVPPPRGKYII